MELRNEAKKGQEKQQFQRFYKKQKTQSTNRIKELIKIVIKRRSQIKHIRKPWQRHSTKVTKPNLLKR